MAPVSNVRVSWQAGPGLLSLSEVPIEALPFPAAIVSSGGTITQTNREWQSVHQAFGPRTGFADWCETVHADRPERAASLVAAGRSILEGAPDRFIQDYGPDEAPCRISITPCAGGALVLHQNLRYPSGGPGGERLAQAQKMETVGRLLGGVAHDFANLLTLIAGYSDILLNRIGEKDPLRPEIDEIRKAANHGSRLTAQLLGFTRNQTVRPEPLDLNTLIGDMQRMLRPIIGEYVDITTSLGANLGRVVADRGQMEQVIMNLVLNARDAMPSGGHIRIATFPRELDEGTARQHGMPQGPAVMLTISDSGHGMEKATLERLFEPFFTTKPEGKGTGLGLNTVQTIVKKSGGDLWASSALGAGATFSVCLPRAPQKGVSAEPAVTAREAASGSETVLLVEDEDGVRRLLTHVLNRRGYHVLEAGGGEEALRIFEERGPEIDLVLTDMVMPKMSGRTLAERLRVLRPEIKVIFMSGYTDDVLVRTGALSPGMSFLQKPLRPDVLSAKVREALDSRPVS